MYPASNLFTSVFLTLQYNLLHPMSKLGLFIVLILMVGRIYAQDYFVLIEADNGQPFYVRVDSVLYSSSARGHLILSQLKDSSYIITIGFPGQVFPERQFSFNVHQNDHAFRLKNEDGKGWWLVDDKGQELTAVGGNSGGTSARIPGIKKDDAFSRLMADLVKDTAVMYTTFTVEQPTPSAVPAASIAATSASTPRLPVNTVPPGDSQSLTSTRQADTTTSTTRDSTATALFRPAHDTTAAARSVANPVDSAVVARSMTVSSVDSTSGRSSDTVLAVHPNVATSVDSGVARSAAVPVNDTSLAVHAATINSAAANSAAANSATTNSAAALSDSMAKNTASTPLYRPIPRKYTVATAASVASTADPLPSTAALFRPTGVTMLTEHRSSRSLRQVYTDHDSAGKSDTVVIIIPLDTPTQSGHPAVTPVPSRTTVHSASADSSHLTAPQGHGPNSDTPAFSSVKSTLPFVNSDCHNFATDYDVDKLRVKMLESAKDDDRILAARKVFKMKCFSTHQIRALSEVFTTDAAKFKFLEAAYPFVSDDHFAELSTLLADPVYSGRFRVMTDHP